MTPEQAAQLVWSIQTLVGIAVGWTAFYAVIIALDIMDKD